MFSTRTLTAFLLVIAAATGGRTARAADDTCAKSYETAQELRADGLLRAARDVLRMCVRPGCPAFVRDDCAKWLIEVDTSLPTAAFVVRMAGKDLEHVTVTCDEELLTERLDGRTVHLDPGKHTCRFEAAGAAPGTIELLIAEGHKNRLVDVELQPARPAPPPRPLPVRLAAVGRATAPGPGPAGDLPAGELSATGGLDPKARTRLAIALAATSVVGVGTFVGLGLRGMGQERSLSSGCAPGCGGRDVDVVRRTYLVADIGLGLGVATALGAAYLLLTDGDGERPRTGRSASLWPVPLADGAAVAVRSLFF